MLLRADGRRFDEIRKITIVKDFLKYPEGSVMIEMGHTKVICTATIENKVPPFLKNTGRGWLTAEYSMLPMSTHLRTPRESTRGKVGGRTHEIQRLIGRSLRAVTDLNTFGEKTIYVDCDVIQADGGTRTASVTGAFVALMDLFIKQKNNGLVKDIPVADYISAVSVGIIDKQIYLDINYEEDSKAEVDMNFVMTGNGRFVEIQGTAEEEPFSRELMNQMIDLATKGINEIIKIQKDILGEVIWKR
jgi:ribonuclease PH